MAAPGMTIVYSFTYRGSVEEWSQQYHFQGDAPSNDTDWLALLEAMKVMIYPALSTAVTIVRGYGYADTDDDAVFSYDLLAHGDEAVGSYAKPTGASYAPGDAAAWIRWKTTYTNSHGKAVYLRKYFHGCILAPADEDTDALESGYKAVLETLGTDMLTPSGDWPGIADPNGDAPTNSAASIYVTTRTLKRRAKRPT